MTVLLTAHKLSRRFGSHHAVVDFSLEIKRGEVVGLLGPNGAGKTTSLRMLSGCLSPDQGQVQINGVDLHKHPLAAKAQLGYLPEKPPLHLELRVDEFLLFAAQLRGLNATQAGQSLQRTCEACGLEAVRKRIIGSLSKGYRQRVGLAQALIHNPALVILDEPTDGLDPQQLQQVRQLIRNLANDHAVLLSSHMLSEVQAACDRVALMSRGQLVKQLSMHTLATGGDGDSRPLLLQLRSEQACEGLLALEGVQAAEQLHPGHYRLQLDNLDTREDISRLSAQQNWGLLEMRLEPLSLESIFAELST